MDWIFGGPRAKKKRDGTKLGEYERKRDFGETKEPAPKRDPERWRATANTAVLPLLAGRARCRLGAAINRNAHRA
jgi:hypothetical protein